MIRVIGRIDDVSANNVAKICERGRLLCWLVGRSHGLTLFKAIFLRPFSGAEIFLVVDVVSLEMSMQVDDRIDDRARSERIFGPKGQNRCHFGRRLRRDGKACRSEQRVVRGN